MNGTGAEGVDRVSAQYVDLFSKVCTSSVGVRAVMNRWAGIYGRLESKSGCVDLMGVVGWMDG